MEKFNKEAQKLVDRLQNLKLERLDQESIDIARGILLPVLSGVQELMFDLGQIQGELILSDLNRTHDLLSEIIEDPNVEGIPEDTRKEAVDHLVGLVGKHHNPFKEPKKESDPVRDLLAEVANSYEDEGCEDCGTIPESVYQRVRDYLGWN